MEAKNKKEGFSYTYSARGSEKNTPEISASGRR